MHKDTHTQHRILYNYSSWMRSSCYNFLILNININNNMICIKLLHILFHTQYTVSHINEYVHIYRNFLSVFISVFFDTLVANDEKK